MAFKPYPITVFPGLQTYGDQEDIAGAATALNVFSPEPGILRVRNGLTQAGSTNYGTSPYGAQTWGGFYIIGYADGTLKVVSQGSLGAATSTGSYTATATSWSFAPAGAALYAASGPDGTATDKKIIKITSAGVQSQGANQPKGTTVCNQQPDDRLVVAGGTAGPSAASSTTSRVWFSAIGDGETWGADDYVDITPGDGEGVTALVSWNGLVFAFKRSKFAVFYGNSTDSAGGAVFNYRVVDRLPDGGAFYRGNTLSVSDGLYFMNQLGLWRTTGGAPVYVSGAVRDQFEAQTWAPNTTGTAIAAGHLSMWPITVSSVAGYWLVHDRRTGDFWIWSYAESLTCGDFSNVSGTGQEVFFPRSNANGVMRTDPMLSATTTDNSTAISAYYQSPYLSFGQRGVRKHIRRTEVVKSGSMNLLWDVDQAASFSGAALGSGGTKFLNSAYRGDTLSWKVTSGSGIWTLYSLIPWVDTVRDQQ